MAATFDTQPEASEITTAAWPRASDWLWRPRHAKLWWTAIPIWWPSMAASTRIPALDRFYDSALAGFLNILFFPMTALMVLGVGYVQQWLAQLPVAAEGSPLSDEAAALVADLEAENMRALEAFKARTDIYDPRSGGLFIGNPLNSQNPHHRF